jgi:hypothetical protein
VANRPLSHEVSSRLPSPRYKLTKKQGESQKRKSVISKTTARHLDYKGLIQVAELIERLSQKWCDQMGANETKCESEEDYHEDSQAQIKGSSEEQRVKRCIGRITSEESAANLRWNQPNSMVNSSSIWLHSADISAPSSGDRLSPKEKLFHTST